MGVCTSGSPPSRLYAIKKEKKLLLVGLTPSFEQEFINGLQSVQYSNTANGSFIHSKYNFGALTIQESTPEDMPWNTMKNIDEPTFFKLTKYWKIIDYDLLLQGWFRLNYNKGSVYPKDIISFMKTFCCIPPVRINAYKLRSMTSKSILNILNVSPIYRKCWSLTNNKECYRHRELSYGFKESIATLFLVNLACYDELDPKTEANKMNRTVKLYQWFLKDYSLYLKKQKLKHGNILLVFGNVTEFKAKLKKNIRLTQCSVYNKYNGPNEYDKVKEYIIYKFNALNLYASVKANLYFNEESSAKCLQRISEC